MLSRFGQRCIICCVWWWLFVTDFASVDALWVDPISLVSCSKAFISQVICCIIKFGQLMVYLHAHDVHKYVASGRVLNDVLG